jgi:hypothetical protein
MRLLVLWRGLLRARLGLVSLTLVALALRNLLAVMRFQLTRF